MAGAWVLTIPCAALIGAGAWEGADLIGSGGAGPIVIGLFAVALARALYLVTQRTPVHAADLDRTHVSDEEGGPAAAPSPAPA